MKLRDQLKSHLWILIPVLLSSQSLSLGPVSADEVPKSTSRIHNELSGYIKTLNFFTKTSGLTPELVDNPLAREEKNEILFNSNERLRLKTKTTLDLQDDKRLLVKIDYDHQAYFGSFLGGGDFRISRNYTERRQFLDLSQTLVEDEDAFYEHRFYRASLDYQSENYELEIGRQQIPWGVGHFFTPTDLFNRYSPTQIEMDERDGVDAVRFLAKKIGDLSAELIYTPNGKQLHSQRFLTRISTDIKGYEVGLIGGRVRRDFAYGFDFSGNVKDSTIRGEFLYREARTEKDFISFTLNADYNLPHNIYFLIEYHFNGQGRRDSHDYQLDRLIRGDIYSLGKNYLANTIGYDITELLRFENRTIFNLDDVSFYIRPELQYEITSNFLILSAIQFYLGGSTEEFGLPNNLYLIESKYSF